MDSIISGRAQSGFAQWYPPAKRDGGNLSRGDGGARARKALTAAPESSNRLQRARPASSSPRLEGSGSGPVSECGKTELRDGRSLGGGWAGPLVKPQPARRLTKRIARQLSVRKPPPMTSTISLRSGSAGPRQPVAARRCGPNCYYRIGYPYTPGSGIQ